MLYKRIAIIALLLLVAVFSFTKISSYASDPDNHRHSIEKTDEKIASVMALSGGAAATSATLSLLPGDMCTPLAEQLAEMAKYFLLILSSLYLEKFLIGISGYIAFSFLVPIACFLLGITILTGKKDFSRMALKVATLGIIIYAIVPLSIKVSDLVYETQVDKVNNTIEEYNNLEIEGDSESGLFNEITSITTETVEKTTSFIDGLMESLAVMIVTSCLIPLLVFVFLVWLVKTVFTANILTLDTSALDTLVDKMR